MSGPDDPDIPPGRYGLTRQQTFVMDRLHELITIEQKLEKASAPFMNPEITCVVLRCRSLFDQAHKLLQWNDCERADKVCDQVDGALVELRSLMRSTPSKQIAERWFVP